MNKTQNRIQKIKNKMLHLLGLHIYESDFPNEEHILFEISQKQKDKPFTKEQALNSLNGNYRPKVNNDNICKYLDTLVEEGLIIKLPSSSKYKINEEDTNNLNQK